MIQERLVFNAKDFLAELENVKKFWLTSKRNKLRIEAHKDTQFAEFFSINKNTGLETAVKIPARVQSDMRVNISTVGSFYDLIQLIHFANVGPNDSLTVVIEEDLEQANRILLRVLFSGSKLIGKVESFHKDVI